MLSALPFVLGHLGTFLSGMASSLIVQHLVKWSRTFRDSRATMRRRREASRIMNKRFDDMRDLIRSEIARVDQKLDRITDILSAIEQQRLH